MANTLTSLIPTLIANMTEVTRGSGHFANASISDMTAVSAGKGQTVSLPGAAAISTEDVTPSNIVPATGDITSGGENMTLSQYKAAPFALTGEEMRAMAAGGPGFKSVQFQEALSALIDGIGTYALGIQYDAAGYAIGTAGTTPFASSMDILADGEQILNDAKASSMGRVGVYSTAAWSNLKKLDVIQQRNTAPNATDFASGVIADLNGFMSGYDQQCFGHTKGTGASYVTDGAVAVGDLVVTVKTGTGTILAGDVVTFAADSANKYVVRSFAGADITLNSPIKVAIADANAMTIAASTGKDSLLVHPAATVLAVRPDQVDVGEGGDLAMDTQVITDPITGLSVRVSVYPGYKQNRYEVSAVYGAGVRPDRRKHIVKLLG